MIFTILIVSLLILLLVLPFVKFFINSPADKNVEWPMFVKIEPVIFMVAMIFLVWCFSKVPH